MQRVYTTYTECKINHYIHSLLPSSSSFTLPPFLLQMKEVPGVRQVASVLQRELSLRFTTVLQPHTAGFNPLYVKATVLDPRYYILLDKDQLRCAKTELLREVGAIQSHPPPIPLHCFTILPFSFQTKKRRK